jgi:hypothetical protein
LYKLNQGCFYADYTLDLAGERRYSLSENYYPREAVQDPDRVFYWDHWFLIFSLLIYNRRQIPAFFLFAGFLPGAVRLRGNFNNNRPGGLYKNDF